MHLRSQIYHTVRYLSVDRWIHFDDASTTHDRLVSHATLTAALAVLASHVKLPILAFFAHLEKSLTMAVVYVTE